MKFKYWIQNADTDIGYTFNNQIETAILAKIRLLVTP